MKVNLTYPEIKKKKVLRKEAIFAFRSLFLLAGFLCFFIDLIFGEKPWNVSWSIIVIWSEWLVYFQFVSPDMVEYNRVTQFIKLISNSVILLFLIYLFLEHFLARRVITIICFSSLIVVGLLFFTDFDKQKKNSFPMFFLTIACLVGAIVSIILYYSQSDIWTAVVLLGVSLTLLILYLKKMGSDFGYELKKYFTTK